MTILALFRRDDWLYIETADRACGYVPIDTCKPIGGRHFSANDVDKTLLHNNNNNNNNNNKTSVSLLDVTVEQQSSKQYEVPYESSANNMYMYKMKHYFRSLDPIEKNDNENVDSGYSDTDSTTNHVLITTTTTTIKNTRDGQIKRAGIKTNGSIPIITSNININIQHNINQQTITANNEIRIDNRTKITKLSTIVEQSCNNTCTSNLTIEKKRGDLSTTSQMEYKKTSLTNLCSNISQLQLMPFPNNDFLLQHNNNMRIVLCDYEPKFVDDLPVAKGEHVTLLDDENHEWIYVISQNGKGFIPRSCV
jgi:hypothetical protein